MAVRTEDATLSLYQSTRRQAEIVASESIFNRNKFVIESPFDGTIADILIDIGQDVSPGTPLLKLVSRSQQIELLLTQKERDGIEIGQTVTITSEDRLQQ
ncbi:HlyD family secretion protein [Patescibacteria group bacterium]|nr:HlyD family secretion protein [Patescibacteria group bacterium]